MHPSIELVVSDISLVPELTTTIEKVQVKIGLDHDFDDILELCSGKLSNDQLVHLHRLWSDDELPRNFTRIGDELIITARD
jgi:hypothetical protein